MIMTAEAETVAELLLQLPIGYRNRASIGPAS